jgi:murein DD-endopeptidase MepM/ murein hydrolase activator NlpD
MQTLSKLLTQTVALGVQALRWFVVLAGSLLLALQRALEWLDSAHPLAALLRPLARKIQQHAQALVTSLAGAMLLAGGGAFAVANLSPDASDLPVTVLSTPVALPDLERQAQQLEQRSLQLRRTDTTRSSDTEESLLRRLSLVDPQAAQFMRQNRMVREALSRPGRAVMAETTENQQLSELSVRWLNADSDRQFMRLVVSRAATGWTTRIENVPAQVSIRMAGGTVNSSLYAASDEARLPDSVVSQLAEIFSSQIDFHKTLRKGARFAVVYEVLEADGEPLRAGKVISAEFINGQKKYEAVWYQEPGQKGNYFSFDGKGMERAYLASPVPFSRKTSGFSVRLHPIYQTTQEHRGIDYAAPTGTPVFTVGDGVVEFAGTRNGYGNVVIIQHPNNHNTLYAHLNEIGVRKGETVTQGQTIGTVGSTGWSTGSHLHFEFRVNGVHVDPESITQQAHGGAVNTTTRSAFNSHAQRARAQLMAAAQMRESPEQ